MAELGIVIAILVAVVGLITPIPPLLLDFFVTANLLFALLVLILSITIKDVLQLSSFPAILLTNTIFRICLSVAITRSILGDIAGGEVVKMFGLTLLGGNLILGIVVYVLITIIQFFVIAKGGERVAEVSARFSLDSLPGRQMAIDADLRMGIIDPDTARQKRQELQNESRFFGALDGTMKFVKGDAIAGIIIVAVNLIGGILIGLIYHDLDLSSAVRTFATLSLGEGLISQIPSFLNGLAAGFLVTRVEKDSTSVGSLVVRQIFDPVAPKFILGVLSFAIAVTSPLPGILFSVLGIGLIVIALAQSAMNSQKFKKELFTFQPKLDDLLTIELNINDDNLMQFSEKLKQKLFSEYGLIISRLAIRKIDSGMKIYIRNRSVFQLDEQPEHDILQLICQKINPFLHELVDEKTVIYLNSIYENNRGQINHENSISFFKAKEIIIALLKEGVRLKPLDIALETLFNLPPGIQIEEGVYEMRKRILPRDLGNLDGTDMYMLDQDDAVIIEETLMQGNVLPFSVVKHLKENLPDSENTVLVVFRCTSYYLKKTLGFTRTKIISTEELPENFQGTKLSTIKIGLKDEIDFASAY